MSMDFKEDKLGISSVSLDDHTSQGCYKCKNEIKALTNLARSWPREGTNKYILRSPLSLSLPT